MKNESIRNVLGRVPAFVKKYAPALALGLIGILILLWPKKQTAQQTETAGAAQPAAQSLLETEQRYRRSGGKSSLLYTLKEQSS